MRREEGGSRAVAVSRTTHPCRVMGPKLIRHFSSGRRRNLTGLVPAQRSVSAPFWWTLSLVNVPIFTYARAFSRRTFDPRPSLWCAPRVGRRRARAAAAAPAHTPPAQRAMIYVCFILFYLIYSYNPVTPAAVSSSSTEFQKLVCK